MLGRIILLFFIVSEACFAGNLPQAGSVEQFCTGLSSMSTPSGNSAQGYVSLWASGGTVNTNGDAYHLFKDGVAISLTAGSYFHAKCICTSNTNGNAANVSLFTADNNFTDGTATSGLTNAVFMSGSTQAQTIPSVATIGAESCHAVPYNMGKAGSTVYPGVTPVSGSTPGVSVYVIGYSSSNPLY